jgi:4-amino-4-deoxy-L-arabinose transferase-like glycosyltransferase
MAGHPPIIPRRARWRRVCDALPYALAHMQTTARLTLRDRVVLAYSRGTDVAALTRRERRWLGAIVLVAFGLRLAWIVYAARPARGFHDPLFYSVYGRSIAEGDGYRLVNGPQQGQPTAYYPVGYPAALGFIFFIMRVLPFGDNEPVAAAIFNLLLGVGTVVLVFEAGRRLFDNRIGLVAAGIVALYPNLIFHTAAALTETFFVLLTMGALVVLIWRPWSERIGRGRLVAFGVLLGLSALVRPISFLVLPGLLLVWLLAGFGWRRALGHLAVIAVAVAVVIAPWTVRNIIVMDSPVLISTNLGDNLCIGRHPGATGAFDVNINPHETAEDDYCFHDLGDTDRPAYEIRRNRLTLERALEYIRDHPLEELRLAFWKIYFTVEHDYDGLQASESYGTAPFIPPRTRDLFISLADFWFWSTSALGLLGLTFLVARDHPRRWFFLAAIIGLALPVVIFFGDVRFHMPVVPLLSVTAAATVVTICTNVGDPAEPAEAADVPVV